MKNNISKEEYIQKFKEDSPMYAEWGNCVAAYINDQLNQIYGINIEKVLKMPIIPRVKKIESLIEKVYCRKNYDDPYNDVTDKVGIRVVVMTEKQIKVIKKIITDNSTWKSSLDVDYIKQKEKNPEVFAYESVHFIVRNMNNLEINGINITKDTPCEVQIRTLEQHAFAEISHDVVYKQNKDYGSEMKRYLARSIALNEASDDLFNRVYDMVEKERNKYKLFTECFNNIMKFPIESNKLDEELFDCIIPIVEKRKIKTEDIISFVEEYSYIVEKVREKQNDNILFRQPVIIMLYYLAYNYDKELTKLWGEVYDEEDLWPIFTDLGSSYGET